MTTVSTGRMGEQLARRFCIRRGWRILHTNWRSGRGEIDIIAQDNACTVFIEVKMRSSDRFGAPEESLTLRKQRILRSTVAAYLARFRSSQFRVDVIAITRSGTKASLRHIRDIELLSK